MQGPKIAYHLIGISLLYLLSIQLLIAQSPCPSDEPLRYFRNTVPNADLLIEQKEAKIQEQIEEIKRSNVLRNQQTYTIPVVVHIVWFDESENIPDAQILAQIDILNQDYNPKFTSERADFFIPAEFEDRVANVGFEFCLATIDPEGNPTSGITRTPTQYDGIGNFCDSRAMDALFRKRLFRSDLGGQDSWDTERYLNIYVARMGSGLLGRATPPEPFISNDPCSQLEPWEDGVVIDPKYFGPSCHPPHHLGRTTTHEIGHYFNLLHIFGLDTDDCDTDFIDDTPEQERPYSGCPNYPQRSCLSDGSDMFMNYMDLVDDDCMVMFTEGQKMRMLAALLGPRRGLIENMACNYTIPSSTNLVVYPNPASECLHFQFDTPTLDEQIDIRVYDISGKRIFSGTYAAPFLPAIQLKNYSTGVYVVEVITGEEKIRKKVMVVK